MEAVSLEVNPFIRNVNQEEIVLRIAGKPSAKQRPRFDPRTKRAYTPPANIISENDVRSVWREQKEPRIESGAISVEVQVVVARPASHFKKNGQLSAEGSRHPFPDNKKPDIDNGLKLICDALNTRAYRDDVQIVKAVIERMWGEWPYTVIKLKSLQAKERENGK